MKNTGGGGYFDELSARISDTCSSRKVFWRKILDIDATSIDYDPRPMHQSFLLNHTEQNALGSPWKYSSGSYLQATGAQKPLLELTNCKGEKPTKEETTIAKNYLTEKELNILNHIVTAYLEIAELQALNRKPMYMKDWIARLDDFLQMTGNEIPGHAGKVGYQQMLEKAEREYEAFKRQHQNELSRVELDFVKQTEARAKRTKKDNNAQ